MKLKGLPEFFWIVTVPTPHSTLGDICFQCDFQQFAQQIRGGLDEHTIVGIYGDEVEARAEAERLLAVFRDTK